MIAILLAFILTFSCTTLMSFTSIQNLFNNICKAITVGGEQSLIKKETIAWYQQSVNTLSDHDKHIVQLGLKKFSTFCKNRVPLGVIIDQLHNMDTYFAESPTIQQADNVFAVKKALKDSWKSVQRIHYLSQNSFLRQRVDDYSQECLLLHYAFQTNKIHPQQQYAAQERLKELVELIFLKGGSEKRYKQHALQFFNSCRSITVPEIQCQTKFASHSTRFKEFVDDNNKIAQYEKEVNENMKDWVQNYSLCYEKIYGEPNATIAIDKSILGIPENGLIDAPLLTHQKRCKALENHPDKDQARNDKMAEINAAYDRLKKAFVDDPSTAIKLSILDDCRKRCYQLYGLQIYQDQKKLLWAMNMKPWRIHSFSSRGGMKEALRGRKTSSGSVVKESLEPICLLSKI